MCFRAGSALALMGAGAGFLGWMWVKAAAGGEVRSKTPSRAAAPSSVFSPAHRTLRDAVADFLGWQPAPVQPIAFPHRVHIERKISCTTCHAGVDQGPEAGLPSVKDCVFCHRMVATDRPEIIKVRAYRDRGEEIPWQRVYGFSRSAHVKFNHAPHIRAAVDCAKCHGDVAQQTAVVRSVKLTMGYCIGCHKLRKAPIECVTCHF